MTSVASLAALFALGAIVLIGLDMALRGGKRREDMGARPALVPGNLDPAHLRRRPPLAQRLSGAVLIAAAIILYFIIRPALGF